jgi:serine/threonine protein phosphatase PrpC
MQVHTICEKGNRPQNEDFIISALLSETSSIHIVADGMGGYEHGDWASKAVAETMVNYFQQHINVASSIEALIRDAVGLSNETLRTMKSQAHAKMGSTLAGLLFINDLAYAFWVGDARIYHLRNHQIIFQSTDHSLINQMAAAGQIMTPTLRQQYGHIVTRAIQGNTEQVLPDIVMLSGISPTDQFILCSDGVHNVIPPSQLEHLLLMNPVADDFISAVHKICARDGNDNFSLISISF